MECRPSQRRAEAIFAQKRQSFVHEIGNLGENSDNHCRIRKDLGNEKYIQYNTHLMVNASKRLEGQISDIN